jgi:hypothetical protein
MLALMGCLEADMPPTVTVIDSAGVTVIAHSSEHLQGLASLVLQDEPAVQLGSVNGSEDYLFGVNAVALLEDQRIAVANGGTQEVLVFERSGQLVHRTGSRGDGPGEFQSIRSLVPLPPDSLGVYDELHRRLSIYDPQGSLMREVSLREALPMPVMSQLLPLSQEEMVLFTTGAARLLGDSLRARPLSESLVVSRTGEMLRAIGSFPGLESYQAEGRMGVLLFSARTNMALADDHLVVGTAETTEIRYLDRYGKVTRIVRWPDRDRAVSEEDITGFIEAVLEAVPESRWSALRARLQDMPHTEEVPPYQDLLSSPAGEIWVGDYPGAAVDLTGRPPPARQWLLVGPDGILRATIETPNGFRPLVISGSEVFGVFMDDLGVETVRAYVIKAPSQ